MTAVWAKCGVCSKCWPAAELPGPLEEVAERLARAECPTCGPAGRPLIAKQSAGRLTEPLPTSKSGIPMTRTTT